MDRVMCRSDVICAGTLPQARRARRTRGLELGTSRRAQIDEPVVDQQRGGGVQHIEFGVQLVSCWRCC